MSAGMVAVGVGAWEFSVHALRREMIGSTIEPHVGSCGLVADVVFFGRFVPCDMRWLNRRKWYTKQSIQLLAEGAMICLTGR